MDLRKIRRIDEALWRTKHGVCRTLLWRFDSLSDSGTANQAQEGAIPLSFFAAASALAASPFCLAPQPTATVAIASQDHAPLEEFYVGTLGFTLLNRLDNPSGAPVLILACGSLGLEIVPAGGPIPDRPESGGLNSGPFKFGMVVPDLDKAHEALVDAGIAIDFGPVSDDQGIRFLMFRDPRGNRIQLFDRFIPKR